MTQIETEYKGYKVVYGENREEWTCFAIDFSNKSLAAVKRKIDTVDRARRKAGAVPVLAISDNGVIELLAVEYGGPITARYDEGSGHRVYTVGPSRYGDKPSRTKTSTDYLCADTPENRASLAAIDQMRIERNRISKRIEDAKAAIPRLDPEIVKHLASGEDE